MPAESKAQAYLNLRTRLAQKTTADSKAQAEYQDFIDRRIRRSYDRLDEINKGKLKSDITDAIEANRQEVSAISGVSEVDIGQIMADIKDDNLHPADLAKTIANKTSEYVLRSDIDPNLKRNTVFRIAHAQRTLTQRINQLVIGEIEKIEKETDDIVDTYSNQRIEIALQQVLILLARELGDKISDIKLFYFTAENNFNHREIALQIELPEATEQSPLQYHAEKTRYVIDSPVDPKTGIHIDSKKGKAYIRLKLRDELLGVIEIDLAEGSKLNRHDFKTIEAVCSKIDSFMDTKLATQRVEVLAEEGEVILESGTFEDGLKELMAETCEHSRANEAFIVFKKPGSSGQCQVIKYNEDEDKITPVTEANMAAAQKLYSRSASTINLDELKQAEIVDDSREEGQILVSDLKDFSEPGFPIEGKIILVSNKTNLTDDENKLCKVAATLISAHLTRQQIRYKTLTTAVDVKVADALMANESLDSTDEATSVIADLRNSTKLANQLTKHGYSGMLRDIYGTYLNKMLELCHQFGGTWLKEGGDAGMCFFGPPFNNQEDSLKLGRKVPEYHAMNAIRFWLALKSWMPEYNAFLREKLLIIAKEKFAIEPGRSLKVEDQEALLARLKEEFKMEANVDITAGINTAPTNILMMNIGPMVRFDGYSDSINALARMQSSAGTGQLVVSLNTYEKFRDLRDKKEAVPLTAKSEGIDFDQFYQQQIGSAEAANDNNIKFNAEIEYRKYKGLGWIPIGNMMLKKSPKTEIQAEQTLNEDQFKLFEDEYVIIDQDSTNEGQNVKLTLQLKDKPHTRFYVNLKKASLKMNTGSRVISEKDKDQTDKQFPENKGVLQVHQGTITKFELESIEDVLIKEIKTTDEKTTIEYDGLTSGIYEVIRTVESPGNPNYLIAKLKRGNKEVRVKLPKQKIQKNAQLPSEPTERQKFLDHAYCCNKSLNAISEDPLSGLVITSLLYFDGENLYEFDKSLIAGKTLAA